MKQYVWWFFLIIVGCSVGTSATGIARPVHHPYNEAKIHHKVAKREHAHRWCDNHPERCAKQRTLHRTWCDKHPVECKARREQRHEWCAKHPKECADKRASDGSWDLDLEDAAE